MFFKIQISFYTILRIHDSFYMFPEYRFLEYRFLVYSVTKYRFSELKFEKCKFKIRTQPEIGRPGPSFAFP